MFRRSKPAEEIPLTHDKPGGKGRPTPTRREAEAAAKARAQVPRTRKEQAAAARAARAQSGQQVRAAMRTGDDRYLPERDRGPVKRFIRDFVDSRFQFIQILLPVLVVALAMPYVVKTQWAFSFANMLTLTGLMLVIYDIVMLRFRLRRELTRRFPDAPTRGTTTYAVMRSLQLKFLRMPKAQVKIGTQLPETYR